MQTFTKKLWTTAAVALTLTLQGCGGGGSDGPAGPTPEGLWGGSVSAQGTTLDLALVVLGDGTYYGLYGTSQGSLGMFQGKGSSSGNKFTSGNGRDYPFGGVTPNAFMLDASFTAKASISGTATFPAPVNGAATIAANYDSGYETAVPLSSLAGSYSGSVGTLGGVSSIAMTIDTSGNYSSITSDGCQAGGTFTPRGTTAVFNVSITTDKATCGESISTKGIGGLVGTDVKRLVFVATTPDRSDAVFATLAKP